MITYGKVWGATTEIFTNDNVSVHRIVIKRGAFCSNHRHETKHNAFYVESGEIEVQVEKSYNLVDTTVVATGQMTTVKPGENHRFRALTNSIVYEIYYTKLFEEDIIRKDVGGV